jgi:hypothetical protein
VKVAVVAAAATVTEAGTVSAVVLLASVTEAPPVGAVPLKVTVQVALPELLNVEGVHETADTVGRTTPPVTVPPVVVMVMSLPAVEEPIALLTVIGRVVMPVASVTFTTATTPFPMMSEFMPEVTHE